MHKRVYSHKSARWFSQWSRKAYAIFLSISKVVHIGRLSVDISTQALLKSNGSAVWSCTTVSSDLSMDDLAQSSSGQEALGLWAALEMAIIDAILPKTITSSTACACSYGASRALNNSASKIFSRPVLLTKLRGTGLFLLC